MGQRDHIFSDILEKEKARRMATANNPTASPQELEIIINESYQDIPSEREIPTEGMDAPTAIMNVKRAPEYEAGLYMEKYPTIPQEWDFATIISSGQHLDQILSDNPFPLIQAIAATFNAQASHEAAIGYADTIRAITIDSIHQDNYAPFFNALDLNHADFVIKWIYPEHIKYLDYRWIGGPDNRLEEWIKNRIAIILQWMESGDEETTQALRTETLSLLDEFRPDFIKNIPTELQAKFIQVVTPQILDAIDQANIDKELEQANTKTIMMFVGGITAVVGTIALFGAATKPKRKAPAPVIINK